MPTFSSSFVFGGTRYFYTMVGTNPATATTRTTTTIPTEIVPVTLVFDDGTVFDPTKDVQGLIASPLFRRASFAAGNTQYGDALMRSEFWKFAQGSGYHVMLGQPTVLAGVTAHPHANGRTVVSNGSKLGLVTFSWFIPNVEKPELSKPGVKFKSLIFFVTADTRVLEGAINTTTTFGGYHDSLDQSTSSGIANFGTIWGAMFTANPHDVTHVGHEVAEWLNDPFYPTAINTVPCWRHPQTNKPDSTQLEVGDPVATVLFTKSGYTFEDAAFLSWFAHDSPSIGINGQYDLLGQLPSHAASC